LISSISFDDNFGQTMALFIIALAGAESAIGLSILVVFYKLTGAISLTNNVNSTTFNTVQNNNNNNNNNNNY
jgi:NADH:ubiquinone oxidoreductase subunit K